MKKLRRRFKGFTVLEAAMAMLLVGVFSSMIIPYWNMLRLKENIDITRMKANHVRKALQGYVMRHGFLPYASNEDGLEQDGMVRGRVPYKTLGIPKYYTYDGFDKPFVFVVNEALTVKKYKGRLIVPITFPLSIPPRCDNDPRFTNHELFVTKDKTRRLPVTFCRILELDERGCVKHFDAMHAINKMFLIKNGKPVEFPVSWIFLNFWYYRMWQHSGKRYVDTIKAPPKFGKTRLMTRAEMIEANPDRMLRVCSPHKSYGYEYAGKNADVVAWVLISGKKEEEIDPYRIDLDMRARIFWQSRFNLAGQLNHPCSPMPLSTGELTGILYEHEDDNAMHKEWITECAKRYGNRKLWDKY